jgi:hypothetical protein
MHLFTRFFGRAGHLDEFCFRRKRIERRRVEYAKNSYRDEFINFPSRSYSHVSPRFYSHAFPQFSYGPNHRSYGFSSRENQFELDALVTAHILVVVIISRIGLVFVLEGPTPTLSRDTWMVHVIPIVVHVSLGQVMKCKGL